MTEDIAKGCSLMAATLHPTFKVAAYMVEDCNNHLVSVSWVFDEPNKPG